MSRLDEVGDRDGWRCWLCDEPVDPQMNVNDGRGPSIDSFQLTSKGGKGGKGGTGVERLAHRGCNTKKGAVRPVIAWPSALIIAEPAVILTTVERLERKGGREVVARSSDAADAAVAADWLADRLSRLAPDLPASTSVEAGGGQHLVVLTVARR